MDVTPKLVQGAQLIESYGNGGFKIAGVRHAHSVMVTAEATTAWTPEGDALSDASIAPIFALSPQPEVVLLGLGGEARPLSNAFRQAFRVRGISVDAMDTGAACRTFNILLAEGRRVVALLVVV